MNKQLIARVDTEKKNFFYLAVITRRSSPQLLMMHEDSQDIYNTVSFTPSVWVLLF